MKEWVRPFLQLIKPEMISRESFEVELNETPLAWRRLASLFHQSFYSDGMLELLGSVLADLPRDVFDRIFELNPFFILSKDVAFCQQIHSTGDLRLVIFMERELADMPWMARRGAIVHELSHVYKDHLSRPFSLDDPYRHGLEAEADALCVEWGFGVEIKSAREYLKSRKGGNYAGKI